MIDGLSNVQDLFMPTHQVNLDALITREDFEAREDAGAQSQRVSGELKLQDLESTYLQLLRKPDFQRETSSWKPETISDLVRSYLDGELIPAVIMWRSPLNGKVFVIDGAHRLSALMAWVHNDYGDGDLSNSFWGHAIPRRQKTLADQTRKTVEKEVGSYKRLRHILLHPADAPDDDTLRRARNVATYKIDLQWVEGNAAVAEKSFFKINGSAVIIDTTELGILKARRKPNAIATRALMNAGKGHKYWAEFPEATRAEIESLAKGVYDGLFKPILESPIKTLDLPIAGHAYSANAFKMIFDMVNMVNDVSPAMWQEKPGRKRKSPHAVLEDDRDGIATVSFLKAVRKAADLVSGNYKGSLGLHPVVYFYGATGRFQPAAFLATVKFVKELRDKNRFNKFTKARQDFEEFVIAHRHYVSDLGHRFGSRTRSLDPLVSMYDTVFEQIASGTGDWDTIREKLLSDPKMASLRKIDQSNDKASGKRRKFRADEKSAAYLREALEGAPKCGICGSRLHMKAISTDHKVRAEDGGSGDSSNAQPTHPYCNSGYKESQHAAESR